MLRSFLIALSGSLVLGAPVLPLFRRWQVLDSPTTRSSHDVPTARGGGVAVLLAVLVALAVSDPLPGHSAELAIAGGGFGLLGLADDLWSLPALLRLVLQGLLALAPLPWLLDGLGGTAAWQVIFALGVWFWLIACVNAVNFFDGINGITAVQAIVAGATWWFVGDESGVPLLALGGAVLAGAALGFLPYNFPRARMFLGDVGSYVLGAWIAVLVVVALRAGISPVAALGPMAITLADTATTIVQRARRGEPLLEAHRSHAYQRLVAVGWSHTITTTFVGAVALCCSAIGVATIDAGVAAQILGGVAVLAIAACYVGLPAHLERREPTRSA
jgi:UDP-N-acetylmuramyl pentapeptide phosphotransferase/UDP-N-acetylglucosamine-1-phosphate transferase